MATIKSYTDIEQSKKLAKILPLESADMYYEKGIGDNYRIDFGNYADMSISKNLLHIDAIPCWSLAALLGILEHPRCFQGDKPIYWFCGCFGKDNLYHEVEADNPVDACYKMILELNKLKIL